MPLEAIIIFTGLCAYTIAVWALGFHYGAKSFRDRNRKFLAYMKQFNENTNPQSQWFKGYSEGIRTTLNALERFLDKFRVEDDNGAP